MYGKFVGYRLQEKMCAHRYKLNGGIAVWEGPIAYLIYVCNFRKPVSVPHMLLTVVGFVVAHL